MKIVVISGSLSENSSTDQLGDRITRSVQHRLEARKAEVEIVKIRLRDHAHAIIDAMLTGFPRVELEEAFTSVRNADAVIALTPAYNSSFSGLFKAFFDVLPEDDMRGVPVIIGATGGTPRHSLITEYAMRPMFVYLHALVASTSIYAATEDWGAAALDSRGSDGSTLQRRIDRAAKELETLIVARRIADGVSRASFASHASVGGGTYSVDGDRSNDLLDFSQMKQRRVRSDTEIASLDSLEDLAPEEIYPDFKSFDELL